VTEGSRVSHPEYGLGTLDRLTTCGGAWVRWDNTPNTTHHHFLSYLSPLPTA
jgi:hypothetical protein